MDKNYIPVLAAKKEHWKDKAITRYAQFVVGKMIHSKLGIQQKAE